MRRLLIGVGVVVLLIGAPLVGASQDHEQEQEDKDAFPLTDDEIEIASLKIDLLQAAVLTLQWKREALQRSQRLLVQESAAWAAWRDDLQAELTALFDCADVYDMETEECTSAAVADPEPPSGGAAQ